MHAPARQNESNAAITCIDEQLDALRAALLGLTEDQARETPCRSALSIAGILKHVEHGMRGGIVRFGTPGWTPQPIDEEAFNAYMGSFALTGEETATGMIERFDATRIEFIEVLRGLDPDADTVEPPAPWYGINESSTIKTRSYLIHQIEEFARHAGHADIIREQIDGTSVPSLMLTMAGVSGEGFIAAYEPAAGTLLA